VEGVYTGIGKFIDNLEPTTSGSALSKDSVKGLMGQSVIVLDPYR
jgi:hypothetical protein